MRVRGYPGYVFEATDPDHPRLIAPNGKEAARFGPFWREKDVQNAAAEHAARVDVAAGRLRRLMEERGSIA